MYERHMEVLNDLSPTLLISVTQRTYGFIFSNCFLVKFQPAAVARLALQFKFYLHAPTELTMYGRIFCACIRGVAFYRSRIIRRGECWGENFLVANAEIRPSTQALAMSYLTLATLNPPDFELVLSDFPLQQHLMRRLHWKQALICGLTAAAEELKAQEQEQGGHDSPTTPLSFTGKLQAAAKRKSTILGHADRENRRVTLSQIMAGTFVSPVSAIGQAKELAGKFRVLQDRITHFEDSFGQSSLEIAEKLDRLQQTMADRVNSCLKENRS
jgi:hypothetical protein